MKKPLTYITILLIIQAIIFLTIQAIAFKLAAETTIIQNRTMDQAIKAVIIMIMGVIWLLTWKKLGEKIYQKYQAKYP